nr:hypothetical protein LRH_02012 [Lacticaseibacillus rhamnosus HN001]
MVEKLRVKQQYEALVADHQNSQVTRFSF